MAMLNWDDPELDDFWVLVFRRLSLKERVKVERVSRKWATLMPYADIHSAHLAHFSWPQEKMIKTQYGADNSREMVGEEKLHQVLEAILCRCGPFLYCLDAQQFHCIRHFPFNASLCGLLVEKAPDLVSLTLDSCVLTLGCVAALSSLSKLEELSLGNVIITDEDLSASITNMNAIEGALSFTINNLLALKKLNLFGTVVSPKIQRASLTELKMEVRGLDPQTGIRDLVCHCPNLESLTLFNHDVPSLEVGALGGLPNLRKLRLLSISLSSGDFASICKGCPQLEDLNLFIHPVTLDELWRLANLKFLRITRSTQILDDAVLASVAKYGRLEVLYLTEANLTDAGLKHLAQNCPNLLELCVDSIQSISDEGVQAILGNCHKLKWLDIEGTPIGDGAMSAVGAEGISLRCLRAWKTKVTEAGISQLMVEREKRRMEGAELVPLKIRVSFQCDIARDDLSIVALKIVE